jgi:hypothetical protein
MAEIVLGIGSSHTPLVTFDGEQWGAYAANRDLHNQRLNTSDGRWLSYDQLSAEVGDKYAADATLEKFLAKDAICQASLDRIAADIAAAKPDVVIIVTDDEGELFHAANRPAIAIYHGDEIVTHPRDIAEGAPDYVHTMTRRYAMDQVHRFPAMGDFAYELIERMVARHIDVGTAASVEDPEKAGFGHGVGFVITRLFGERKIPVIPILLNTYFPPNAPPAARCHDIGRVLRAAIEESPRDVRVAVIASGGLSHFTVDEALDRRVIAGLCDNQPEKLRTIPMEALNSGSSEIRNWITLGGVIEGMTNRWIEYQPLYRTPAGTGIGVAFGVWSYS